MEVARQETIHASLAPEPDDEFWLAVGEKMTEDSFASVQDAAKIMLTCLGLVQSFYIAVLGFGEFSKAMAALTAFFFTLPILCWLAAVFLCVRTLKTSLHHICLQSPTQIRRTHRRILNTKQLQLDWAFGFFGLGLYLAVALLVLYR